MDARDVLRMPAGRDIDAFIAEHAFGWKWDEIEERRVLMGPEFDYAGEKFAPVFYPDSPTAKSHIPPATSKLDMPAYSERISDAWQVIERLEERGVWVDLHHGPNENLGGAPWWWCSTISDRINFDMDGAETAPLAICRAALRLLLPAPE